MPSPPPKLSIALIVLLVGFPLLSETIYSPALPQIASSLNIGAFWAEMSLSIYFIGFALGVLVWGLACDTIGRRPSMLWGLLLYCVGTSICWSAQGETSLLAGRFIQAFGASTGSVVTQTILRDLYKGTAASKLFGLISAILQFSPAVGPLIGGYLTQYMGWRSNFGFLIGLIIVIALYAYAKLPETHNQATERKQKFWALVKQLLSDQHIWISAALIGITNGMIFSYYAEAPFLFIELLNLTPFLYGWIGIVIASAGLFAWQIQKRVDSGQKLVRGGALCSLGGSLLLTLLTESLSIWTLSGAMLPTLLVGFWLVFAGIGLMLPQILSQACKNYQESKGTAGAILGLIYYIFVAILTTGISFWHDGSASALGTYFVVLNVCLLFFSYAWNQSPCWLKKTVLFVKS